MTGDSVSCDLGSTVAVELSAVPCAVTVSNVTNNNFTWVQWDQGGSKSGDNALPHNPEAALYMLATCVLGGTRNPLPRYVHRANAP